MTSKEDLKMIKIKCHPNANPNPMIDEALNNIEKDLEVLEILKKYGYKKVFELEEVKDGGYIFNREDSKFIPKEEFNLLKKVLDNGK